MSRGGNRLLTFEEVEKVADMWQEGATRAEIAGKLEIAIWVLDVRRTDQLKHLPRRQGMRGGSYSRKYDQNDPPAEVVAEIEQRMADVRAGWDEQTRVSRLSGVPNATVRVDEIRGAIRNR